MLIIRLILAILFGAFSFAYMFNYAGYVVGQAQHVLSNGITSYSLLYGAIIVSSVLLLLQMIISKISYLPKALYAMSYLPSASILYAITTMSKEDIETTSFMPYLYISGIIILLYVVLQIILYKYHNGQTSAPIVKLLWQNMLVLLLIIFAVARLAQAKDTYIYELKAERLILNKQYEEASLVGIKAQNTTLRLNNLRMYALSKQGKLPECLFDYPQPFGSEGLIAISDTNSLQYRFSAIDMCKSLGCVAGNNITSFDKYIALTINRLQNDSTRLEQYEAAKAYYLCALLLNKQTKSFVEQYKSLNTLPDTIIEAYKQSLPRAYREAFAMAQDELADSASIKSLEAYKAMCDTIAHPTARYNLTKQAFGTTYYFYHDN